MSTFGDELKSLESKGVLRPELRLGVVSSISANRVRVNLKDAGTPSGAHYAGGRYGKGEVGEFILIEGQQSLLLGRIIEVQLPERERHTVSQDYAGSDHLDAIGYIQLLGSISMNEMNISAGVNAYPRLGDRVYAAPHQFVALIPALMDRQDGKETGLRLELGSVDVAHESRISITPEKLFGRHCAILGATGGGKSWTTARIIEECIKHDSKIILLDATGEYSEFPDSHVMHCHLADPVETATGSISCNLPPMSFQESDFIAMFEPSGKVQGPKLKEAIKSLRLASIKSELATDGILLKANKSKKDIYDAESDAAISEKLENPRQPFDVRLLTKQIREECVWPAGNYGKDSSKWGDYDDSSYSFCLSLLSRISGVITSPAYRCVFTSAAHESITDSIEKFQETDKRLMRICLSGIQHEFHAREIIANVLGRYLLAKARQGDFRRTPFVIIVDEAHAFLGRHVGSDDSISRLDAFELIAKEGRKYGLNICLATQRPRDITEGVLSQMGTLVVHRLTNDRDREVVERACGDIDRSASSFLPNLKPGEAAIIGVDFPIPLTIQIEVPTFRPKSEGPNYQEQWSLTKKKENAQTVKSQKGGKGSA